MSISYEQLMKLTNDMHTKTTQAQGKRLSSSKEYAPVNTIEFARPHIEETISLIQLADNSMRTRARASAMLWRAMNQEEDDEFLVFSYYLSFLTIMTPELGPAIELAIRYLGYTLEYNVYPGTFAYEEYDDNETRPFTHARSVVCLGLALLIPFKNITTANYRGYFEKRVAAMANLVGGEGHDIGVPLSVGKCQYIKGKMSQFHEVRRSIMRWLVSQKAHAETLTQNIVRYVLVMHAWNEMTGFFFVLEALVSASSPVLLCLELAGEVKRYFEIANVVFNTEHPSLYRHLAPSDHVITLDKSQYPTLFAVAQEILGDKHTSIKQLVGANNMHEEEINRYKTMHLNFVRTTLMITRPIDKWMPELLDPDVRRATTQMRHYGLQQQDYLGLKTLSAPKPAGGSTSVVRDSHEAEN